MGPMGHMPGAPARGAFRAETYLFRQRVLVEMVQFVSFPKRIGRTTPSNQAMLLCREGVILAILQACTHQ